MTVSSGMVTSIGLPGAARSQEEVGVMALGGVGEISGVASVGVTEGLGVDVPLRVGVTGVWVGVSAIASVRRASMVWYAWVTSSAGVGVLAELGRLHPARLRTRRMAMLRVVILYLDL
jgi:hypothetical protein